MLRDEEKRAGYISTYPILSSSRSLSKVDIYRKMREKTGGRQKGTPNKLTSRIKEEIGDIVNHTLMSIDIANLKPIEKIKLLQVLCQYIIPRLTTQHLDIEKHETPREVQITIVDTDGNVKEKVKETTKAISTLDEKDLGLLQDMNEIIWEDVD